MEQEHLILAALVLIVIFMINKGCDCKKNEKFGLQPDDGGLMAQRIRYGDNGDSQMAQRIRYDTVADANLMAQRIRYGDNGDSQMAQRIRYDTVADANLMAQRIRYGTDDNYTNMAQHVNMNNDYQGRLMNHIRRDSKREMIHNIMTGCGDK
jgi:hypothetical protein